VVSGAVEGWSNRVIGYLGFFQTLKGVGPEKLRGDALKGYMGL
jgi:hypothetical protein